MSGVVKKIIKFDGSAIKTQSVDSIIDDAKSIIRDQVTRLKIRSNQGFSLEPDDVKSLRDYVKSLVELSREEREIEKSDKLNDLVKDMSNEQLLELYKKQIEKK